MGRRKTRRKIDRSIPAVDGRAIAKRPEARMGEVIMQSKKKQTDPHDHGGKRPAGEQAMGTAIYEELQKLIREISQPKTPKPSAAGA